MHAPRPPASVRSQSARPHAHQPHNQRMQPSPAAEASNFALGDVRGLLGLEDPPAQQACGMHENGDNQRARLLARTQCQARAHRCSNGLGCVDAGHAARREHHADTWMMCVPCGVEYRAHLKGLLHLLERGLRRLSWTLQVSPRCFVPWHM